MSVNNQIQTGTTALGVNQGGTGLTSTTINQLLYTSSSNVLAGLSTANSSYLSTNGSGVPSLGSFPSTGCQSQTNTTWTPTDASGASLTLTINYAIYTKIGNIIILSAQVVYPTTSNSSQAKIGGLPASTNQDILLSLESNLGTSAWSVGLLSSGSSTIFCYSPNGTNTTVPNSTFSTGTVTINAIYST